MSGRDPQSSGNHYGSVSPGPISGWPFYGLPVVQGSLPEITMPAKQADADLGATAMTLDSQRANFERELLSLAAIWNAAVPVNKLPRELLSATFACLLDDSVSLKRRQHNDTGWLPLMRVCRHWCAIARDTSLLWRTIIVNDKTEWFELALDRSRRAPLRLVFHHSDTFIACMPRLVSHVDRIQHIALPPFLPSSVPALRKFFKRRMSALTRVLILFEDPDNTQFPTEPGARLEVGHRNLPRVVSLRLQNVSVSWSAHLLTRLVHLELIDCNTPLRISFQSFLDALRYGVVLYELSLINFLSSACIDPLERAARAIRLPKLRVLHLEDSPARVRHLLRHLSIPGIADVYLKGLVPPGLPANDASISFASLLPPVHRLADRMPLLCEMESASVWVMYEHCEVNYTCSRPKPRKRPVDLFLSSPAIKDWRVRTDETVRELGALLPVAKLLKLELSIDLDGVSRATWDALFDRLPALEEFRTIYGLGTPIHILGALQGLPSSASTVGTDDPGESRVRCARMRRVMLGDIPLDADLVNALAECLRVRAERGAWRLARLVLSPDEQRPSVGDYGELVARCESLLAPLVEEYVLRESADDGDDT